MIIRKGKINDISSVVKIFDKILSKEERGEITVGWVRGIYPTEQTALSSLSSDELFVMEYGGEVVGAARINQIQVPEYSLADWQYKNAQDDEIMVLHTLVIDPDHSSKGLGRKFVEFYEEYAKKQNCPYLRMDTNAKNTTARRLYQKLGYREVGIVPCDFNGIDDISLVCLEKKI